MDYSVEIHTSDGPAGKITLSSSSNSFVLDPPESPLLRRIVSRPIWVMGADSIDDVYPDKEPMRFIQNLYKHYKSQALRVTRAEPDGGNGSSEQHKGGAAFADDPPPRAPPRRTRTTESTDPSPSEPPPPPPPPPLPPTLLARPRVPHAPPVPHQSGGPGTQRRYGLRPGPGWRAGGTSRRGTPIWLWGPHERAAAEEEEEEEVLPPPPEPAPPPALPAPLVQVPAPPTPPAPPPPLPTQGVPDVSTIGGPSQPTAPQPVQDSEPVAGTPQRPDPTRHGPSGGGGDTPTGTEAPGTGTAEGGEQPVPYDEQSATEEPLDPKATAKLERVNRGLNKWADILYGWGHQRVLSWINQLQEFINEVGVDDADEALLPEQEGPMERVAYQSTDPPGQDDDSEFIRRYLDRVGIMMIKDQTEVPQGMRIVRGAPAPIDEDTGEQIPGYREQDILPTWTNIPDKLEEAKILPGLETTEDLSVINGAPTTHLTPDVMAKLDEKYGKDNWIVKPYGDEAYANFGIFRPQYAQRLQKIARHVLFNTNNKLKEKGFTLVRHPGTNHIIGVMPVGQKGERVIWYRFGSKELNALPDPEIRELAGKASKVAHNEHGAALPFTSDEFLFQKTGMKINWDNQLKEDGTRNALGVIYPDGKQVNFGTPEWEAIQKDVANAYMVDKVQRTVNVGGVQGDVKYMAQPAFPSLDVSEEDYARGLTWEVGHEGRVHIVTRDGKASIVPYASMAHRGDPIPITFYNDDAHAMERAALETIMAGPESERQGQVYAPDVMKTADGWKVIERNASVSTGSSAWLEQNPLVIDAYVSHLAGRDPAHVQFIRKLLGGKPKARPAGTTAATQQAGHLDEYHTKMMNHFETGLRESGLDEAQAQQYRKSFDNVIRAMPAIARQRLSSDMRGVVVVSHPSLLREKIKERFLKILDHPDAEKLIVEQMVNLSKLRGTYKPGSEERWLANPNLRQAYQRRVEAWTAPEVFGEALAAYRDGHLAIDGLGDDEGLINRAVDYYKVQAGEGETPAQALQRHLFAHEMAHSIDGWAGGPEATGEYSSTPEWKAIYEEELKGGQLTDYGGSLQGEAFAEFGARLYGRTFEGDIAQRFPKATEFFKSKGLWPG